MIFPLKGSEALQEISMLCRKLLLEVINRHDWAKCFNGWASDQGCLELFRYKDVLHFLVPVLQ